MNTLINLNQTFAGRTKHNEKLHAPVPAGCVSARASGKPAGMGAM